MRLGPKHGALAMLAVLLTGCSASNRQTPCCGSTSTTPSAPASVDPIVCEPATRSDRPAGNLATTTFERPATPTDSTDAVVVPIEEGPQHKVTLEDIRQHVERGTAVIVDVRSPESFAAGHIRGAINIPASQMERYRELGLADVDRDQLIIIYCSSASCHSSDMVYEYLLSEGFSNMLVFAPGWAVAQNL